MRLSISIVLCLFLLFSSGTAWLGINPQRDAGQPEDMSNPTARPKFLIQAVHNKLNVMGMPDRMLAMKAYLDAAHLPQTAYQRKINTAFLQAMAKVLAKSQIVEVDPDDMGSWSNMNSQSIQLEQ